MLKVISLVLISEFWHTLGQLLFKKATTKIETPSSRLMRSYLVFFGHIAVSPAVWVGAACMVASIVFWLMALTQNDLSFVYPLGSTQYVATLIGARLFLGEKIDSMKFIGTALVVVGIIVIARS